MYQTSISNIISALQQNNDLFAESIFYADPNTPEVDNVGVTDTLANYALIEPLPVNQLLKKSTISRSSYFIKKRFKLLVKCSQCDVDVLVEFCCATLSGVAGVTLRSMATDSERIYREETGGEVREQINLVRVEFDVAVPKIFNVNCLDLCLNSNC